MKHNVSAFDHEGAYRGTSCTCGFTASTGVRAADYRQCLTHLETELDASRAAHKEALRLLGQCVESLTANAKYVGQVVQLGNINKTTREILVKIGDRFRQQADAATAHLFEKGTEG